MMFRQHPRHTAAALAAALMVHAPARAQAAPVRAGDDLTGLWGAEPLLGPQVRGALLLDRDGQRWTLRVAGFEATAEQRGDSVTIALAGGQGTLRVWTDGALPTAYWVQPAGMDQPFASPVPLRAAGPSRWRGMVHPVDAQFPLYLMITRDAGGALRGTFRNPAVNWPGRVPAYLVQRDGEALTFTNPRTGTVQWRQPYDSSARTITFDFGAPIVLRPRTREQAAGFVTRAPSLPPYTYRVPPALDDGWRTGPAGAAGVDPAALQSIVRALVSVDPLDDVEPRIHALLVAHRGVLVLDEYFRGHDASMPHDLRSASKTITSILAGAAMQHGAALSSSTPLGMGGITLGHLLSHSSGLACNDDDDTSPGNEDTMQSQQAQPDWYAFYRALPRVAAPGSTYSYCSAGLNMAGGMVATATHRWLPRSFDDWIARPLQFGPWGMNLMPTGEAYAGGGMRLRPRDFLKLGQLYVSGGTWHSTRIVPAAWVRTSTAHVIDREDGSDDGYGWHRHRITARGRTWQTYEASGNGGQFVVVVPALQLVIAVTAGSYGQYGAWRRIREQLVPLVMTAVR